MTASPATKQAGSGEPKSVAFAAKSTLDDFSVLLKGDRLQINASVDKEGLQRLKQVIQRFEEILDIVAEDEAEQAELTKLMRKSGHS